MGVAGAKTTLVSPLGSAHGPLTILTLHLGRVSHPVEHREHLPSSNPPMAPPAGIGMTILCAGSQLLAASCAEVGIGVVGIRPAFGQQRVQSRFPGPLSRTLQPVDGGPRASNSMVTATAGPPYLLYANL